MAHLLRLIAFWLLALSASPVIAQDFSGCASNVWSGPNCPDASSAVSNAERVAQLYATEQRNLCSGYGHPNCDRFKPKRLPDSTWVSAPFTDWIQVNFTVCTSLDCTSTSGTFTRKYPPGPTPEQCEARNTDPEQAPGTRLSLAMNSGPKCVGGCVLDIVGDPLETVPGRVQGQPVVYYRWNQSYTGESCESDADPGDNAQDLEPTETAEGDKQCNPSLGVCVNENGDNEYCTFNPDGTPSSCVPAVDYDNDGINDDDDTQPGDPTNGSDEGGGNESDNSASGGAKCPHDGGGPPACKGDAIQCNLLFQQYLARCAADKVASGKLGGGIACSMSEALTCTNLSSAECWAKAMQKKAGCAAEGIGEAITGQLAEGEEGTEVDPASVWVTPAEGDGDIHLDMGGWLGSRACPTIPAFSVMGNTISFESVRGDMCNFFAVGGMLVLLFAAYQCARILGET